MRFLRFYLVLLLASIDAASARPSVPTPVAAVDGESILSPAAITPRPASAEAAATRTVIWSTTETSVTHLAWIPATVVTMVTTQTVTTLIPNAPAARTRGPGDGDGGDFVVETVIGRTTYEFRLGYSDGHSSTSWSSATRSYATTVAV